MQPAVFGGLLTSEVHVRLELTFNYVLCLFLIQLDMRSEEYRLRATELQTTLENVVVSLLL